MYSFKDMLIIYTQKREGTNMLLWVKQQIFVELVSWMWTLSQDQQVYLVGIQVNHSMWLASILCSKKAFPTYSLKFFHLIDSTILASRGPLCQDPPHDSPCQQGLPKFGWNQDSVYLKTWPCWGNQVMDTLWFTGTLLLCIFHVTWSKEWWR